MLAISLRIAAKPHPTFWSLLTEMGAFLMQRLTKDSIEPVTAQKVPAVDMRLIDIADANESAFVAAWNRLADKAIEPNPFHESWYLLPSLKSLAGPGAVQIFTIWNEAQGDELLGILPLMQYRQYGRWPLAHYQNWLHPNMFLGTPLVKAGHEQAFFQALLDHLDRQSGPAIFFHINGLVIGGPLEQALSKLCNSQARKHALVHRMERAMLEGVMTAEAYFTQAVRPKKRKELRRQQNRLAEMGDLTFWRGDGTEGLEQWIDEFLVLEHKGWKGENGSAIACAAETSTMFRGSLRGAAGAGKLELLDLRLGGKPLAMLVNFLSGKGAFSFKTAFDEDYARFSPGVLLQLENLALLERDGTDYCDSCASEGHPMIDSLWTGRRAIGRYSVAIGGTARRVMFGLLLNAETAKMQRGKRA
jgi:CelD/BcsL family acetyltransferase involved in cellulose biosynthesis